MSPEALVLTKAAAWYAAQTSDEATERVRAKAHVMDIMAALRWLISKKRTMTVFGRHFLVLGKLYEAQEEVWPLVAKVLSPAGLTRALNSRSGSGSK